MIQDPLAIRFLNGEVSGHGAHVRIECGTTDEPTRSEPMGREMMAKSRRWRAEVNASRVGRISHTCAVTENSGYGEEPEGPGGPSGQPVREHRPLLLIARRGLQCVGVGGLSQCWALRITPARPFL